MLISLALYHKVGIEMFDDIDDLYEHKQKSLNAHLSCQLMMLMTPIEGKRFGYIALIG